MRQSPDSVGALMPTEIDDEFFDDGMCECGANWKAPPHTCPYKGDVNGDYLTLCTCCSACESNCADDI